MNKIKKTKIAYLTIDDNRRCIFMSDIHGDIKLFKKALEEVDFTDQDELFVLGDMIEKGDFKDNLLMLNEIITMNKKPNIHFMAGNCDEIFRFIEPPLDEEKFLYYALERKKSIINDLADEHKIALDRQMNIKAFISQMREKYPQFYDFIDQLPDVIFINKAIVLVHGGILNIQQIPTNAIDVLKFDRFLEASGPQPIPMIVGHYPTRNYRSDITNVNPIFDSRKNIICIDGGNNVVKGGQLNVLILDNLKEMNFSFIAVDHYPKYVMKQDVYHEPPQKQFSIQFGKNEVEILAHDLDFYLVRPIHSTDELWVHQDFVFESNHHFYCYDGSNTFINLKKGDQISIIKMAKPYSLIKHQGIIGLIETEYIS